MPWIYSIEWSSNTVPINQAKRINPIGNWNENKTKQQKKLVRCNGGLLRKQNEKKFINALYVYMIEN